MKTTIDFEPGDRIVTQHGSFGNIVRVVEAPHNVRVHLDNGYIGSWLAHNLRLVDRETGRILHLQEAIYRKRKATQ